LNNERSFATNYLHSRRPAPHAGLVWVVDPEGEEVLVYRRDDTRAILTSKDYLDGEGVVPGFRCLVADLFTPPA